MDNPLSLDEVVTEFVGHIVSSDAFPSWNAFYDFYKHHNDDSFNKIHEEVEKYARIMNQYNTEEWKAVGKHGKRLERSLTGMFTSIGIALVGVVQVADSILHEGKSPAVGLSFLAAGLIVGAVSSAGRNYFEQKRNEAHRAYTERMKTFNPYFPVDKAELREELHRKRDYVVKTLDLL